MSFDTDHLPTSITDRNVKLWVLSIFISLSFVFIYFLGWKQNFPIVKQIFIDKKYEYKYEERKGNKTVEKTVDANSDLVKEIGYHHLKIGLIMVFIGIYFLTALFWMFKSRKHLLIAVYLPLILIGLTWLYATVFIPLKH